MEESLKKEVKSKELAAKKNSDKKNSSSSRTKARKSANIETSFFAKSLAKEKWGQIQTDMSKAINHWEDIAKKYEGKPNHDDKQMQEIKRLLQELQKKLSHFG